MIRVHFITLSRSDYTTLRPVAAAALEDPSLDIKVIAGGSHLLERFGKTIEAIEADGLPVDEVVEFLKESDDTDNDIAAAYGRAVNEFVRVLSADPPDYIFIVGDRWEMLAVATAASMLRIPIAHHSGGDITQGSADNQTRYVLTTLSHLHFTALEEHAQRLIHMGEETWRVTATGEPALTMLETVSNSAANVRDVLGLKNDAPFVLATFHPTSYDSAPLAKQIEVYIEALGLIEEDVILTAPNPDPGSGSFFETLSNYAASRDNIHLFENLGAENYYAAMSEAQFMIGNSSSGLWEAPSFGLPVINIGARQDGRVRGGNVIDAALDIEEIRAALVQVRDPAFQDGLKNCDNPYVQSDTIERILSALKKDRPKEELLAKIFIDPLEN